MRLQCADGNAQDPDLFKFSTGSMEWADLSSRTAIVVTGTLPSARFSHTMTAVGPEIYVFGGEIDGVCLFFINPERGFRNWTGESNPGSNPSIIPFSERALRLSCSHIQMMRAVGGVCKQECDILHT